MWILRFHLLRSNDYNKVQRICKKYGFQPRKYSSMSYTKALLKYMTVGGSWRSLGREFGLDHISLYRFYELASSDTQMMHALFHVFLDSSVARFVGDARHITSYDLDNSQQIYDLTSREFTSILERY